MKTSRKDGILVMYTKNPYKMAIDGRLQEKNTIICHDIDYENEGAAYDLQEALMAAFMDVSERNQSKNLKIEDKTSDQENENFLNKESPTEKEIEVMGASMMMPILISKSVGLKNVIKIFESIALNGLVLCEGNIKMTSVIWKTINRQDRLKIAFGYMAFFVNPLQQLLIMSAGEENRKQIEVPKE